MVTLLQLQAAIDARVTSIRDSRPGWPCRKGCDRCCHELANVPRLTAAEWGLLREGLATLAPEHIEEIRQHVAALASQPSRPLVCPLLDRTSGACRVYARRPLACRTYGYYVQRDLGLYCRDIEVQVADGALADVVWGNHDAIDHGLSGLGEVRALTDWFDEK